MNEGLKEYLQLTPEQQELRLRRCGLEAALSAGGNRLERDAGQAGRIAVANGHTYKKGPDMDRHKQQYLVKVFNLVVLEITPLGTGRAMSAAAGNSRPAASICGDSVSGGAGVSLQDEGEIDSHEDHGDPGNSGDYGILGEQAHYSPVPERRRTAGLVRGIAVRALYSLGLDSGEVRLKAMGGRRYLVEQILPLAEPAGKPLPEPYRTASLALDRGLARELPGRPGMLMGMDPEFLLLRETSGRVVPASRYLPVDGVAGCDAGPPGTRGMFPVAELRPAPRGEPRALLAQLMSAAATADRMVSDRSLRWRAGGMPLRGWALGGHLHFSGVRLTAPLLRALDNYLALPLLLLEDARAAARRPRYGVLGDFRIQPHGGFEYRTLPSFLVSPVIAKGAVFLAHLIVSRYEDLTQRPLDREELHAAYYSGSKDPLRAAWAPLQAQLRALDGYAGAAPYVEPLFRCISAEQTWDESRDIRPLWTGKESMRNQR